MKRILILLSLCIAAAHCSAQRLDSLHTLREVVVSSRNSQSVIAPQQLEGDQLRRLGSLSVADALRYFAGVQLKDYGGVGGIKTVNIRSMGSQHVGVFYDGIQLANAQNGQVDLGQYSLDNVQAISLYNGQKSHIFQSARDYASAGSIYLWTRRPEFTKGETYHAKGTVKVGSFGLVNPSALIDLRLSSRVSASLSAEWLSSNGKYKFRYRRRAARTGEVMYDTTAVRQNGDVRATRLEAALFGTFAHGRWMVKGYNYTSERGVPGAIVNNVWRRGERIWDNNSFLQGTYRRDFGRRYRQQWLAKYAYYRTRYVNRDTTVAAVDNIYRQKEFYLSSAHMVDLTPWWSLSAAYDVQWNKMSADMYGFVYPTRWTHYASAATSATFGRLRIQGSVVMTYVHDRTRQAASPGDKTAWTPALFASWRPFAKTDFTLRAFAKRSFRMPTFNDLYYAEMGNSRLSPERATQYDAGFAYNSRTRERGLIAEWGLQADVYRNWVHDKIIAYPKGAQFRWTMLNLGRVRITGADIAAHATLHPARLLYITCRLQYTWQQAIDLTSKADTYYGDQIPYIPWHSGSAVVEARYRAWTLDYSFIYTGERYNQQENIVYNHTQPWYTSDLALSRTLTIGKCRAKAAVEVCNLFSQDYDVIINYPMPKRNYRITLSVEI